MGNGFRGEALRAAVVDRAERDPLVVAASSVSRSEKTWNPPESVRIGAFPAHERMQSTELGDQLLAGPEMEVVRVPEHDLGAERAQLLGVHRLHRCLRPDRHERGGRHVTVGGP